MKREWKFFIQDIYDAMQFPTQYSQSASHKIHDFKGEVLIAIAVKPGQTRFIDNVIHNIKFQLRFSSNFISLSKVVSSIERSFKISSTT